MSDGVYAFVSLGVEGTCADSFVETSVADVEGSLGAEGFLPLPTRASSETSVSLKSL